MYCCFTCSNLLSAIPTPHCHLVRTLQTAREKRMSILQGCSHLWCLAKAQLLNWKYQENKVLQSSGCRWLPAGCLREECHTLLLFWDTNKIKQRWVRINRINPPVYDMYISANISEKQQFSYTLQKHFHIYNRIYISPLQLFQIICLHVSICLNSRLKVISEKQVFNISRIFFMFHKGGDMIGEIGYKSLRSVAGDMAGLLI